MCRLIALTSDTPLSPIVALKAMEVMKEGHDGSGVGILLRELSGPFEDMRDAPILSGIFSQKGLKELDRYMMDLGFMTKYKISIKVPKKKLEGVPRRDVYLVRAYEYPEEWEDWSHEDKLSRLLKIRLALKEKDAGKDDMIIFSFWPDTIMIKEIGDPLEIGDYLGLDRKELYAGIIMAQGRQNTNYSINLYACHPFFLEGYSTMTNGENTAFVPISEYLSSRNIEGYGNYSSDSEVFTHILHYTLKRLDLGLSAYKHIITPLLDKDIKKHPDSLLLKNLKHSCRKLIIDGPNCVIGTLPDHTMFMVQDKKKLRPGVVGGRPGMYAFSSEICGLDAVIPDRDKTCDYQPMYLDTAIIDKKRREIKICRQTDVLPPLH